MTIRQLFLDLDGVLGDFDQHYENLFGIRPNQDLYEPSDLWEQIRKHGNFYRTQPLMSDARELWDGVRAMKLVPIILTGIPDNIPNVKEQKQQWVAEHFGPTALIICCRSVNKKLYGKPGDVLVDDRLKYAHHWTKMGGVFVHHTSASDTLRRLAPLFGIAAKP